MNQVCKARQGGREGIILAKVRANVENWLVILWNGEEKPCVYGEGEILVKAPGWVAYKRNG